MPKLILKNSFAVVPNSLLNNQNISLKAKGLYAYMQSKPENWDFTIEKIAGSLQEGYKAIKSGLDELKIAGYLTMTNFLNDKSQWDSEYTLYAESINEKEAIPDTPPRGVASGGVPQGGVFNKKDEEKKIIKKDSTTTSENSKKFNLEEAKEKLKQYCDMSMIDYNSIDDVELLILENYEYWGEFKAAKLLQMIKRNQNQSKSKEKTNKSTKKIKTDNQYSKLTQTLTLN